MAFIFDCYFSSEECITPYKGIKITQVELAKLKEVMKGIIRLFVMRQPVVPSIQKKHVLEHTLKKNKEKAGGIRFINLFLYIKRSQISIFHSSL